MHFLKFLKTKMKYKEFFFGTDTKKNKEDEKDSSSTWVEKNEYDHHIYISFWCHQKFLNFLE